MQRIHAVVPLKALERAKSRLAGALGAPQRAQLIRAMLEQVAAALAATPGLAQVSVLTTERALVPRGLGYLADTEQELNAALARAARDLRESGTDIMLMVAADLPFLTAEELGELVEASGGGGVVAAADWKEEGTNALAVPLRRPFPLRFGPGSLAAHEAAARAARLPWSVLRRPGLALDVDDPAQLASLARAERYAFLAAYLAAPPESRGPSRGGCAIIPPE